MEWSNLNIVKALIALSLLFSQVSKVETETFYSTNTTCNIPVINRVVDREESLKTGYGKIDKYGNHYPYSYYYYATDADKLEAYRTIYNGLHDRVKSIGLSHVGNLTTSEISEIYTYIMYDTPDIYYVDEEKTFISSFGEDRPFCINVEYCYTEDEIKFYEAKLKEIRCTVRSNTPENCSWYDLYIYIHDFITQNVEYSRDSTKPTDSTIIGALIKGDCTCQGYTMAFNYLCRDYGITTAVGTGVNKEPHIWSVVPYQGEWYNIDTTYNDSELLNNYSSHVNFMLSDEALAERQGCVKYIEGEQGYYPSPICKDSTIDYLSLTEDEHHVSFNGSIGVLEQILADKLKSNKTNYIMLSFENSEMYNQAIALLNEQRFSVSLRYVTDRDAELIYLQKIE